MPDGEWHQYGRTPFGQRYSPLTEITTENVSSLKVAWQYQTGDVKLPDDVGETTYQVTPLKVNDTLYLCTPHNWAIALDATTGKEKWKYDPNAGMNPDRQHQTCRGVTYYVDRDGAGRPALRRARLPADLGCAADRARCGHGQRLHELCRTRATLRLEAGMHYNPAGYYYSTSPPVAVAGKIIVGGAVNDNYSIAVAIRRHPRLRRQDRRAGLELGFGQSRRRRRRCRQARPTRPTRRTAGRSSAIDEALGIVYIPLGNQVPDQLGMGRSENVERFSSSIVALDIDTGAGALGAPDRPSRSLGHGRAGPAGAARYHGQDGTPVPALVGPTKQGDIYVLDRRTGEPIIPVREEPAPGGAIPEDFTVADAAGLRPHLHARSARRKGHVGHHAVRPTRLPDQIPPATHYEGRYTPPSLQGTIVYPGNFGTFNWGSVAVDPERQVMFGMPTYLAFTSRLVPRAEIPPKGEHEKASEQGLNRNEGAPYGVFMGPFLGPLQIPCQAPPWGYVAGADLRTGKIAYKRRNGTVYDMTPLPLPFKVGVPGIGGPMITKGGVAFLGAAVDNFLRAYDLTTGRQLWEARLPAGGQATPMTYETSDGKQYVVMVAGGHGSVGTKPGDYVIAYTLP